MYSCKCEEKKKPLKRRDWKLETWKPYKWWGPNASNYDGRFLIDLYCNKCEALWRNSNPHNIYWNILGISPFDHKHKTIKSIKNIK